ncbi:ABC transporter ATP-binding protein [Lysinibacillus capsici]|uniref:ABC transporter ATP-binding protein n=1 Tax=Lysinibacillus capsici TaxID=2115968 RepID=UPI002DB7EA75|nr:ABC transporter ATP-binding protein [Lysinibacillus capsici]MEC1302878.1 ABC transporter ATP-binding protein [Lysinibacillus capsici]
MYIYEFIKNKLFIIFMVLIFGLLSLSAYLYIPTANKSLIDEGIYSGNHNKLIMTVIILFLSFVLAELLLAIKQVILTYIENLYSLFIRINIHKKVRNLKDIDQFSSSQLISYHINDVNIAKQKIRRNLDNIISYIEVFIICLIVSFISLKFLIIVLLIIPIYAILPKILGNKIALYSTLVQGQLEKITGTLTNSYNISKEIRIYQKEIWDNNKTETEFRKIIRPVVKLDIFYNLYFIGNLLYSAFLCLIFYFGAILVQDNKITIGTLFALTTYIGYISRPIQSIVQNLGQLKSVKVSESRIKEVLKSTEILNRDVSLANLDIKKIEFNNVILNVDNSQVLKDVSFFVKKGEFLGITGVSGSGKTSILNLLAKLSSPTSGEILINDINIENFDNYDYYSNLKYVFQESNFIQGTLIENMFLAETDIDKISLLKKLLVIFNLEFLSNNLNYMIENNGANLSGGQKQRLSVIRALLCNPTILLLDEATSGLDSDMANKIISHIKEIRKEKITILITHDPNILKIVDNVIVINNGRIGGYNEEHNVQTIS